MTTYPSLYAALEPGDRDGQRGKTVRCTATRRELGFIYWTATGSVIAWHFQTAAGIVPAVTGETTTERNAVQRLRDLHKGAALGEHLFGQARRPRIGTCTDSPHCARRGCDRCEAKFPQLLPSQGSSAAPAPAPSAAAPAPSQGSAAAPAEGKGKGSAAAAPAPAQQQSPTSRITWTTTNTNTGDLAAAIARGFAKQGEKQ